MHKRVFLLFGLFIFCAGATFFVLTPHPKKHVKKAFFYLKQKNYAAAELALKPLGKGSHPATESLYRGYLEQMRGRFDLSERFLQTAFKEAKKRNDPEVLQQVLLLKAAHAYFEKRDIEFYSYVDRAQNLSYSSSELAFFSALKSYMQHDYAEALRLWSGFTPTDVHEWMALSIERLFPPIWRKLHMAHCLIESGNVFAGREMLAKENSLADAQEWHDLVTLFLGFAYLKEAQTVALDQRSSYYTIARFYFERSHVSYRYQREKQRVISEIEEETKMLLTFLSPESFHFVHVLEQWQAQNSIERLSDDLVKNMVHQTQHHCVSHCEKMRNALFNTHFYRQVSEKMLASLALALKAGQSDDFFTLWSLVDALHSNPKAAAKEIAHLTLTEIFETIKQDDPHLPNTLNYLIFWKQLGASQVECDALARDLLVCAKLFWQNDKQEKKGQHLMEIALNLSMQKSCIEKEIASFLTYLYNQAEKSNMIHRLSLIYDAMAYFEINRQDLSSKATLANHLADAQYHYAVRNYPSASIHASWVLKLDPQNESARRIVGLCAFNLGEYASALCYLSELQNPDEDTRKAQMLAQVFVDQHPVKQLCQIDPLDPFEDE